MKAVFSQGKGDLIQVDTARRVAILLGNDESIS